jgi:hypothetical protein
VELSALDDAATKLVLIQGEDVVGAAGKLLDLFEGGNGDWGGLNVVIGIKAQDSVVALNNPVVH